MSTNISEVEGNRPTSPLPKLGDNLGPKTTNSNDDLLDWESWPIGRPGPFLSDALTQKAMDMFRDYDRMRPEWSRTEEKVVHVAEFSTSGRGEFGTYNYHN